MNWHEKSLRLPYNPNMCSCGTCGRKALVEGLQQEEEESEGWEYQSYMVDICPFPGCDGIMDDYWYDRHPYLTLSKFWILKWFNQLVYGEEV